MHAGTPFGVVGGDADDRSIRFVRELAAPPERVWRALTEPSELPAWLADATIDLQQDGEIEFRFDDGTIHGTITELEPERVLAYSWHEGPRGSHVRVELRPAGGGTRLTLVHTRLGAEEAPGFGGGWHQHLDLLAASVEGAPAEWSWERFHELKARYVELATTGS